MKKFFLFIFIYFVLLKVPCQNTYVQSIRPTSTSIHSQTTYSCIMGGIQEEKQNINSLQSKVHDVKSYIKHRSDRQENRSIVKLEQDQRQVTNSFELSNLNTIILDQNSQHSFGEEIYIPLTIPDSLANAIVYIYDDSDQVIKTIVLNDRSKTTLHVYSEKLSSGVYSYSLIAEGQAIETKKLIYVR